MRGAAFVSALSPPFSTIYVPVSSKDSPETAEGEDPWDANEEGRRQRSPLLRGMLDLSLSLSASHLPSSGAVFRVNVGGLLCRARRHETPETPTTKRMPLPKADDSEYKEKNKPKPCHFCL